MPRKIVEQLKSVKGLKIECPKCQKIVGIKRLNLFNMYEPYPARAQEIIAERTEAARILVDDLKIRGEKLALNMKRKPQRIETGSHASNFGKISEQILPAFLSFPYKRAECRPLFQPVDYLVFNGLSRGGNVESIKFIDVKTGNGRLTQEQRTISEIVIAGKVEHRVIE